MARPRLIQRYTDRERVNHWSIVLLFLVAAFSGLALFHPSLWFLSAFVGGGNWARILHPFFGVLMFLGFGLLALKLWRDNRWTAVDREWMRHARPMLRGDRHELGRAGKYNAGQKAVFWLFALCLLVLLVTGVLFWQPYFAPAVPVTLKRLAVLLHAIAAFVLVLGVIVHVYAAIWVKGSVRAMTRGTVTEAWAREHHPLWHAGSAAEPVRTVPPRTVPPRS
jgi:formate dehydrogenase subunit gamma